MGSRIMGLACLAVAVAFGGVGCEAPPPEASGALDVSIYLAELDWRVRQLWPDAHPRSYELRFSVEDASGREVDSEVVLTPLYEWGDDLVLACVPGEQATVRARLQGAYAGRPREPRGGRGGLAFPEGYETYTTVLCAEDGQVNDARLPGVTTPVETSVPIAEPASIYGWITLDVHVAVPERLAGRALTVTWDQAFDFAQTGPFAYTDLFPEAVEDDTVRFSVACYGEEIGTAVDVRLQPLVLAVDGQELPRDAWWMEGVSRTFVCPALGETLGAEADVDFGVSDDLSLEPEVTP
ncbi:MAG: hypothetical protein EP329_10045 [Deltaproteobacteria bacterium]|nr:MAG: hypothetical protein EP329_10045 [Deltaproteobacteria bacterium]